MKKLMTAAAAAAFLAVSSLSAMAAEVTGSITSIDAQAGTIVLSDGQTYKLPEDTAVLDSFKAGDQVKIVYEVADNGDLKITSVEAATM